MIAVFASDKTVSEAASLSCRRGPESEVAHRRVEILLGK